MKPRKARTVCVTVCDDCGGVHIEFADRDGNIFATAEIGHKNTEEFVRNIADQFVAIQGLSFDRPVVH